MYVHFMSEHFAIFNRSRRGHDRMVVGFGTNYAIGADHH
jgi:hypothetical protein